MTKREATAAAATAVLPAGAISDRIPAKSKGQWWIFFTIKGAGFNGSDLKSAQAL